MVGNLGRGLALMESRTAVQQRTICMHLNDVFQMIWFWHRGWTSFGKSV